jgi:hypothetical protein
MRVKPVRPYSEAPVVTGLYVACLDCGQDLAYSWDEMKIVSRFGRMDLRSVPATAWRRWPITTIAITIVIAIWIYDGLSASSATDLATLMPSATVQHAPPIRVNPLIESQHSSDTRTVKGRARHSKADFSAFKQIRVGKNEVDYVAEDVTVRICLDQDCSPAR